MKGKMFIVDDEPVIRKGLAKMIDNNPLGWLVAGEAANGIEALEKIREVRPDLVMTDIRMPMMDGIELARLIFETMPEIDVIILTGYRDFEYAQAAIKYGVKQFLLKPCPEEEFCRVLQQSYEHCREKVEIKEREMAARIEREDQLLRSMWRNLPYDTESAGQLERVLSGKVVWLLQVESYFPNNKSYESGDLKLLLFAVSNILQELMALSGSGYRQVLLEHDLFVVCLDAECEAEALLTTAVNMVKQLLGISISMREFGLFQRFKDMEIWLEGMFQDRSVDRPPSGDAWDEQASRSSKVQLIRTEMTELLLLGRPAELESYMRRLLDSALLSIVNLEALKLEVYCAALAMDDVMRKELEVRPQAIGDIGKRVAELHLAHKREEVKTWFDVQIRTFEQTLHAWQMEHSGGIIQRAIRYIEEHYAEECAMPTVASYTHLSPNYFGSLFKKETGESFSAYVTRFRMEKAKLLLKNTDKKVSTIGQSVGFPGSNYFATAFKQMTGLSPSEYRKQASEASFHP
ncbi:response regulator [Paenibacillus sp. PL2-23]|uniref:response regulator transcription factor n=1 Tax=Paenibacillus sp. PL2-23 TaxID=2100729 RepID=UPI0030F995BC